jgi:hypothetical protein
MSLQCLLWISLWILFDLDSQYLLFRLGTGGRLPVHIARGFDCADVERVRDKVHQILWI